MKALTIKQPWAWLIIAGYKRIENRTWKTGYRGALAIHAGKAFDVEGWLWVRKAFPGIRMPHPDNFTRGAVIGTVQLQSIVTDSDNPWFGGPYGWVFDHPRPLVRPVGYKGSLALWEWEMPA